MMELTVTEIGIGILVGWFGVAVAVIGWLAYRYWREK